MSTELSFSAVAAKIRWWYNEEKLSHQQIADKLIAEDIAPALGHPCWDWKTVDAIMVLARSARHAQALDHGTTS